MVRSMIFDHAAKELNQALLYRQEQFSDDKLYFEVAPTYSPPKIALKKIDNTDIIILSIPELLEDPIVQQQLRKIPKILQKKIDWTKLTNYINQQLQKELDKGHTLQVFAGKKTATIVIKKGQQLINDAATLSSLFS